MFQSLEGILSDLEPVAEVGRDVSRPFQSLEGILSDLECPYFASYHRSATIQFQSLEGILSDLEGDKERVRDYCFVSIPRRDFIGFRDSPNSPPVTASRFQSLEGILSDLESLSRMDK